MSLIQRKKKFRNFVMGEFEVLKNGDNKGGFNFFSINAVVTYNGVGEGGG